jgi:hypothetical protein
MTTKLFTVLLVLICGSMARLDFNAISRPLQEEALDLNKIISGMTSRETESRAAFANYGYRCDLVIRSIKDGKATGEYRRTSEVALSKSEKLEEKTVSFPKSSLTELIVTPDDLEDISIKCMFPLETANAAKYKFTYIGKDRFEEAETYVFKVEPKVSLSRECLYSGRVWARVSDLRIVRMLGRSRRKTNQQFPLLDRRRVEVGDYMFPSRATADEKVVFTTGTVHVQMEVQYTGYVKLRS